MSVNKIKLWQKVSTICLVIGCVILSIIIALRLCRSVKVSAGSEKGQSNTDVILIDPGHGGEDGGAVSADGTVEKDINLDISLPLADMLRVNGYTVRLTRDSDYSIYDPGLRSIREKKVSDLKNRLDLINKSRMTISIHQNHFTQSQYFGTQIFYSTQNPESQPLAKSVRQYILSMLQPKNTRELKQCTKDIYLLYNATSPAIIVECGFLSNADELNKLKDPDYQQSMAYAIACGVMAYGP